MDSRPQRAWSEARIHRWLEGLGRPSLLAGSRGHDAAVLHPLGGRPVLCTDQAIAGVHVDSDAPPAALGRKAVARTLSDLAATGAAARAVLLAVRVPDDWTDARVRSLISAAHREAQRHGAELVGGDLSGSTGAAGATVTALGEVSARGKPVGRDRARVGQVLLLTGPTGGSRLGRHLRIAPRLAAGRALADAGATAMIDVSDGLWLDLERLAAASGVALELGCPPLHRDARRAARRSGRTALDHALTDGEDHELVAALPRGAAEGLLDRGLPDCPGAVILGRVRRGRGLRMLDGDGAPVTPPTDAGWIHRGGSR